MPKTLTQIVLVDRARDVVAYVAGHPQHWAPGSSRLEAVGQLIARYPQLAASPCPICGQAVGNENVSVTRSGEMVHLECFHQGQVEPLR